jgi:prephenate dehydrogenase
LSSYEKKLREVGKILKKKDAGALEKLFSQARAARERWLHGEYR